MMRITRDQAKRFLLAKQGLMGRYRFAGKEGVYQYIRQAGCIQFDPVDVCGKNAELTLQSRVRGFRKQMLSDLLYKDRLLFDYIDKELSIWTKEDWPYFAGYRQRSREHGQRFKGIPELEEQALAYIRGHGPVSSDTLPIPGKVFWHSSMHWSGNWERESQAARSVLEQLYTDGTLVIHHKTGSRKYYDLAENYFDRAFLEAENPCPDRASFLQWRVARRIGAIGLLWNRRSDAWLGIEMNTEERNAAFADMEKQGRILEVQVQDIRFPVWMLREDLPLLESVLDGNADMKARMEFLAPLDPMLWDRKLIEAVWDYQYSWEIYTPAPKRRYGYYVLPVLYGQELVGRIEAAADRKTKTLEVRHIWYEPGVRKNRRLQKAMDAAVGRFADFNECDQVKGMEDSVGETPPEENR
ncbi:MAG: YcaQ family DNA glycosylase [Clostridia bacterium]|nr:YcaQ family DNA glycosylase [Clostridia bacterium]